MVAHLGRCEKAVESIPLKKARSIEGVLENNNVALGFPLLRTSVRAFCQLLSSSQTDCIHVRHGVNGHEFKKALLRTKVHHTTLLFGYCYCLYERELGVAELADEICFTAPWT